MGLIPLFDYFEATICKLLLGGCCLILLILVEACVYRIQEFSVDCDASLDYPCVEPLHDT